VNNNVVAGNYIGTDLTGTLVVGNTGDGVRITGSAQSNRVGTDGSNDAFNANERNVITGNIDVGVYIDTNSSLNVVAGNFIGTDVTGTLAVRNTSSGVQLSGGAKSARVERNLISGNVTGVLISGAGTAQHVLVGNRIGTNAAGTAALNNSGSGVQISSANNT